MCQNSINDASVLVLVQSMQQQMEQVRVNAGHCRGFMSDHNAELTAAFQEAEQQAELLNQRLEDIVLLMNARAVQPSATRPKFTFFE
ncbi:hypothetical protein ACYCS5_01395 [Paenibacillus sp. SEL3]